MGKDACDEDVGREFRLLKGVGLKRNNRRQKESSSPHKPHAITLGRPTSLRGEEGRRYKPAGAKAAARAKPLRKMYNGAFSVRILRRSAVVTM
eukprot:evm.model.NODE_1319_length_2011_cov_31.451019.1